MPPLGSGSLVCPPPYSHTLPHTHTLDTATHNTSSGDKSAHNTHTHTIIFRFKNFPSVINFTAFTQPQPPYLHIYPPSHFIFPHHPHNDNPLRCFSNRFKFLTVHIQIIRIFICAVHAPPTPSNPFLPLLQLAVYTHRSSHTHTHTFSQFFARVPPTGSAFPRPRARAFYQTLRAQLALDSIDKTKRNQIWRPRRKLL